MDVTIIGTGNMARGISTRALAGGHTVTVLGNEAEDVANELSGDVRTGAVGDTLAGDGLCQLGEDPGLSQRDVGEPMGRRS